MFALDANTVIHSLKGKGAVRQRLEETALDEIVIPAVVVFELEFGTLGSARPSHRRRDLRHLLGAIRILPFDLKSAERAARIRRDLEQLGMTIGPLDTLIAGTALAHDAVLVTHNLAEFSRVPGLRVEDWF